jgi:hypothetical protein
VDAASAANRAGLPPQVRAARLDGSHAPLAEVQAVEHTLDELLAASKVKLVRTAAGMAAGAVPGNPSCFSA